MADPFLHDDLGLGVTVLVNSLSPSIDERALLAAFASFYPVRARVMVDHSGDSRGFGYLRFATKEDAEAAAILNGTELDGRRIRVGVVTPRAVDRPSHTNVYVSGIPHDWTEQHLRDVSVPFGPIVEMRLMAAIAGHSTLAGFVRFERRVDSDRAVRFLNGFPVSASGWLVHPLDPHLVEKAHAFIGRPHVHQLGAKYAVDAHDRGVYSPQAPGRRGGGGASPSSQSSFGGLAAPQRRGAGGASTPGPVYRASPPRASPHGASQPGHARVQQQQPFLDYPGAPGHHGVIRHQQHQQPLGGVHAATDGPGVEHEYGRLPPRQWEGPQQLFEVGGGGFGAVYDPPHQQLSAGGGGAYSPSGRHAAPLSRGFADPQYDARPQRQSTASYPAEAGYGAPSPYYPGVPLHPSLGPGLSGHMQRLADSDLSSPGSDYTPSPNPSTDSSWQALPQQPHAIEAHGHQGQGQGQPPSSSPTATGGGHNEAPPSSASGIRKDGPQRAPGGESSVPGEDGYPKPPKLPAEATAEDGPGTGAPGAVGGPTVPAACEGHRAGGEVAPSGPARRSSGASAYDVTAGSGVAVGDSGAVAPPSTVAPGAGPSSGAAQGGAVAACDPPSPSASSGLDAAAAAPVSEGTPLKRAPVSEGTPLAAPAENDNGPRDGGGGNGREVLVGDPERRVGDPDLLLGGSAPATLPLAAPPCLPAAAPATAHDDAVLMGPTPTGPSIAVFGPPDALHHHFVSEGGGSGRSPFLPAAAPTTDSPLPSSSGSPPVLVNGPPQGSGPQELYRGSGAPMAVALPSSTAHHVYVPSAPTQEAVAVSPAVGGLECGVGTSGVQRSYSSGGTGPGGPGAALSGLDPRGSREQQQRGGDGGGGAGPVGQQQQPPADGEATAPHGGGTELGDPAPQPSPQGSTGPSPPDPAPWEGSGFSPSVSDHSSWGAESSSMHYAPHWPAPPSSLGRGGYRSNSSGGSSVTGLGGRGGGGGGNSPLEHGPPGAAMGQALGPRGSPGAVSGPPGPGWAGPTGYPRSASGGSSRASQTGGEARYHGEAHTSLPPGYSALSPGYRSTGSGAPLGRPGMPGHHTGELPHGPATAPTHHLYPRPPGFAALGLAAPEEHRARPLSPMAPAPHGYARPAPTALHHPFSVATAPGYRSSTAPPAQLLVSEQPHAVPYMQQPHVSPYAHHGGGRGAGGGASFAPRREGQGQMYPYAPTATPQLSGEAAAAMGGHFGAPPHPTWDDVSFGPSSAAPVLQYGPSEHLYPGSSYGGHARSQGPERAAPHISASHLQHRFANEGPDAGAHTLLRSQASLQEQQRAPASSQQLQRASARQLGASSGPLGGGGDPDPGAWRSHSAPLAEPAPSHQYPTQQPAPQAPLEQHHAAAAGDGGSDFYSQPQLQYPAPYGAGGLSRERQPRPRYISNEHLLQLRQQQPQPHRGGGSAYAPGPAASLAHPQGGGAYAASEPFHGAAAAHGPFPLFDFSGAAVPGHHLSSYPPQQRLELAAYPQFRGAPVESFPSTGPEPPFSSLSRGTSSQRAEAFQPFEASAGTGVADVAATGYFPYPTGGALGAEERFRGRGSAEQPWLTQSSSSLLLGFPPAGASSSSGDATTLTALSAGPQALQRMDGASELFPQGIGGMGGAGTAPSPGAPDAQGAPPHAQQLPFQLPGLDSFEEEGRC